MYSRIERSLWFEAGALMRIPTPTRRPRDDNEPRVMYLVAAAAAISAIVMGALGVPMDAPPLPTGADLELLLRSPTAARVDGVLLGLGWMVVLLVWVLCGGDAFAEVVRTAVLLAKRASAAWQRREHRLSAASAPTAVIAAEDAGADNSAASETEATDHVAQGAVGPNDVLFTVQPGDSLGHLAEHFYGDWQAYTRILHANRDRVQPDGRCLRETGTIHPGWTLIIPEPTSRERGVAWESVSFIRGDGSL